MTHSATTPSLADIPLRRLLDMLDETERVAGEDSDTAHALAGEIRRRLKVGRTTTPARPTGKGVRRG